MQGHQRVAPAERQERSRYSLQQRPKQVGASLVGRLHTFCFLFSFVWGHHGRNNISENERRNFLVYRSGVVAACLLVYLGLKDNGIDALDHFSTATRENVGVYFLRCSRFCLQYSIAFCQFAFLHTPTPYSSVPCIPPLRDTPAHDIALSSR